MRRTPALLLASLALLGASLAVATADHDRRPRVSADINHVISSPTQTGWVRAVIGRDDRGPFLATEDVVDGRVTHSVTLAGLTRGRHPLRLGEDVAALWPGQWAGDQFQLWAWFDGAWQTCTVTRGAEVASCGGGRADAMAAARACDPRFTTAASRDACASAVMNAGRDPMPVLEACDATFDGDAAELGCLQAAIGGVAPVEAITACEAAFDGDVNEQACLVVMAPTEQPAELVRFCDQRENGDDAELACLRTFAR